MSKSKLFLLVAAIGVTVFRNGKQEQVTANTPFEFEAAEVLDILRAQPGSLRKPINETSQDENDTGDIETNLIAEAQKQAELDRALIADAKGTGKAPKGPRDSGEEL
jgi:hypothetical protein